MKLKVSKTIEDEVDLSLPAYRKGICHYFKIISDKLAVQVTDLKDWHSISLIATGMAITHGTNECTAEEFNLKYTKINLILMDKVLPDTDDYEPSERVNRNVEASEGMER